MIQSVLRRLLRSLPVTIQDTVLRELRERPLRMQPHFGIKLNDFISFAYGDNSYFDKMELARIRSILGGDEVRSVADARAIIMALDQQKFPTPILIRFSSGDVHFTEVNGVSCAIDRHDMSTSAYGAHWTVYEPNLVACFRKICRPGSVVCDIGANVGFHSMMLAGLVGKSGRVYAFEPNSENCRLILAAAEHNRVSNLVVLPVALSERRGWAYFSTHIGSNGGLLDQQKALLVNSGTIVPTFTLDELSLPKIDVIKVDVEGAEYKVLAGGEKLLAKDRPLIISEFSIEMTERVSGISGVDFLTWMEKKDYNIFILDRDRCEAVEAKSASAFIDSWGNRSRIEDLLFVPSEKKELSGSR